jgi:hypothetical protein
MRANKGTQVDLGGVLIGTRVHELAAAIEGNRSDADLTLDFNEAGGFGCQSLVGAMLMKNNVLTTLRFADNIGAVGTKAIAEALKTNRTLKVLWLSRSKIGDAGIQHLTEALMLNDTLTAQQQHPIRWSAVDFCPVGEERDAQEPLIGRQHLGRRRALMFQPWRRATSPCVSFSAWVTFTISWHATSRLYAVRKQG